MTQYHEKYPPKIGRAQAFERGHNPGQAGHCLLYGDDTAGAHSLSISILKKGSEAPLHIHSREDETFYVIEGTLDARVGDNHHTLEVGDSVFLPRGLKHRLLCLSGEAKLLMLIHPPGLEKFFDEIDQAVAEGPASKETMIELSAKYGITILENE
ncbi:MAG: cupin domain-containing protein [Verrucomicrobiota bacterium]